MGQGEASSSVAEAIYVDLLRQIVSGVLPAGSRLRSERELAADYGTNRNTLREAMRKLEQGRLITVRQGQGVTVADFRKTGTIEILGPFLAHGGDGRETVRVMVDLLVVRVQVLEMAVAMAAQHAQEADIERLEALVAAQVEAFERADRQALVEGDIAMVDALVDAAHSLTIRWIANTLLEVYRGLVAKVASLWVIEPIFPRYLRRLVDAVARGDAEDAVDATRDYYQRTDDRLFRTLEPFIRGGDHGQATKG